MAKNTDELRILHRRLIDRIEEHEEDRNCRELISIDRQSLKQLYRLKEIIINYGHCEE
jgi:hypothetical protein